MEIKRLADTRSGSGISSVNYRDQEENQQLVVFKNGEKRKLKEEVDGVEKWHRTYPGVAPQILRYKKEGQSAALLIEHLHGITFEQVVIKASGKTRNHAMEALKKTLFSIWSSTRKEESAPAGFIRQIRKRLADVYAVHPHFKTRSGKISGYQVTGLERLLARADKLEKKVSAPFSVFIHGDFNVDNVIYDPQDNKIRFIDLHRSAYMDYVQDVSVFMVSNFRLQVLDKPVRQRIRQQVFTFYQIARKFSVRQNDPTFEIRLALGLARSLLTSTRFILDQALAGRMFLRANFLLEQVLRLQKEQYSQYRIPILDIFRD
jgi:aminoglycoside phosphotransferase (APT) family kinase protein